VEVLLRRGQKKRKREREILLWHRPVASASSAAASYGGARARGRGRRRGTLARAPGGACSGARSHSPRKETAVGVGEQGGAEKNGEWGAGAGRARFTNGAWTDFAEGLGPRSPLRWLGCERGARSQACVGAAGIQAPVLVWCFSSRRNCSPQLHSTTAAPGLEWQIPQQKLLIAFAQQQQQQQHLSRPRAANRVLGCRRVRQSFNRVRPSGVQGKKIKHALPAATGARLMRELVATGYGQFVSAAVLFTAEVGRAAGPRRRRRSFFDLARIFFVGASEGQGAGCPRVPVPVPAPRLRLTSLSLPGTST
jgi:hypothetical protein